MLDPHKSESNSESRNPWEILVIAGLYFVPGTVMLLQKEPLLLPSFGNKAALITTWSPAEAHFFGGLAIAISVILIILYIYTRRAIIRDTRTKREHFLDF
jgi:hypothetical protein